MAVVNRVDSSPQIATLDLAGRGGPARPAGVLGFRMFRMGSTFRRAARSVLVSGDTAMSLTTLTLLMVAAAAAANDDLRLVDAARNRDQQAIRTLLNQKAE